MNIQKFTQKSMEAVSACEKLAYDYGNQEIEQEHLLVALLQQEGGLIPELITKMEINLDHFKDNAIRHLEARTKVSGAGQVYVGKDLNQVLIHAEDEAKAMGDEYVSVEHLFLAMIHYPNRAMKEIFKEYGITRERFLQVLSTVRGNQRVVSDNPEATYDTLEKYGYDMVERARDQKLDPVIGRDAEIRNVIRILSRKTKNNRADRRARRRQDCRGGRTGSAYCPGRCAGRIERQETFRAGYGSPCGGSKIPGRV